MQPCLFSAPEIFIQDVYHTKNRVRIIVVLGYYILTTEQFSQILSTG